MEILEGLKWRYATKKFDSTKKINKEDLDKLKEAVQLSASSYGLQLYNVLIIEDSDVRGKLRKAAYDQSQVTDASHVFLFCNYTKVVDEDIDKYVRLTAQKRDQEISELQNHAEGMKNGIRILSDDTLKSWTSNQVYIALGTLLAAAAELRIDACPMEGFDKNEFNKILGLDKKGLNASVMMTAGYRAEDDKYQHLVKVRKPQNELFEMI
jgi:nitroreductase/dihydropteridine reductase